jgi:membrane fusion protein (multidrug efflux system)
VEDGLSPGDRLIVEGLQKVHPGVQVQPVEEAASATGAPGTPASSSGSAAVTVATAHR